MYILYIVQCCAFVFGALCLWSGGRFACRRGYLLPLWFVCCVSFLSFWLPMERVSSGCKPTVASFLEDYGDYDAFACRSSQVFGHSKAFQQFLFGTGDGSFSPYPLVFDVGLLWWRRRQLFDSDLATPIFASQMFAGEEDEPPDGAADVAPGRCPVGHCTVEYDEALSDLRRYLQPYQFSLVHRDGYASRWILVVLYRPFIRRTYVSTFDGAAGLVDLLHQLKGGPRYFSQGLLGIAFGQSVGLEFVEKLILFVTQFRVSKDRNGRFVATLTFLSNLASLCELYQLDKTNILGFMETLQGAGDCPYDRDDDLPADLVDKRFVRTDKVLPQYAKDIPEPVLAGFPPPSVEAPEFGISRVAQSIDPFPTVPAVFTSQGLIEHVSALLRSSLITSAFKVLAVVWALVFVVPKAKDSCHILEIVEQASNWKSVPERAMNVSGQVLEHILLLGRRTQAFLQTGDWKSFLIAEDETVRLAAQLEKFKQEVLDLERSPVYGLTAASIQERANELLPMVKLNATISGLEAKKLRTTYDAFMSDLAVKVRAQTDRPTPFGVVLTGPPSIGKSRLIDVMLRHFSNMRPTDQELDIANVYTRTNGEAFWSSYKSSNWAVIFDDLAAEATRMLGPGCNPVGELLQVINSVPFFPAMPGVEEKGTVSVNALYVIVTTNNPQLNLHHTAVCPSATYRRLPIRIHVSVVDEFKRAGTNFIDPSKCVMEDGTPRIDVWEFTVERFEIRPNSEGRYYPVGARMDSKSFWLWYTKEINSHFTNQIRSKKFTDYTRTLTNCSCCNIPKAFCSQSEVNFQFWFIVALIITWFIQVCVGLAWFSAFVTFVSLLLFLYYRAIAAHMLRLLNDYRARYYWLWTMIECGRLLVNRITDFTDSFSYFCTNFSTMFTRFDGRRGLVADWSFQAIFRRFLHLGSVNSHGMAVRRMSRQISVDMSRRRWAAFVLVGVVLAFGACSITWNSVFAKFTAQAEDGPEKVDTPVNPWHTSERRALHTVITRNSATGSRVDIGSKLGEWVAVASAKTGIGFAMRVHAIPLKSQSWLLPGHFVREALRGTRSIKLESSALHMEWNWNVDDSTVTFHPTQDYAIIRVTGSPVHDFSRFIANTSRLDVGHRTDAEVLYPRLGSLLYLPVRLGLHEVNFTMGATSNTKLHSYVGFLPTSTQAGDCGVPLVGSDGKSILGFHIAGSDKAALFQTLDKDWIDSQLAMVKFASQGEFLLGVPNGVGYTELQDVPHKCPIRFQGLGDRLLPHMVLGSVNARVAQFRSRVCPNLFFDFWSRYYSTTKMRPRIGTGEDWAAPLWKIKRNFLEAASTDRDVVNITALRSAAAQMLPQLKLLDWSRWVVLSHNETLFGRGCEKDCPRMKFQTSAGVPYCTSKSKVMVPITSGEFEGYYELTEVQQARIAEMEERARLGIMPGCIFKATLKDEPLKKEKIEDGKIRIFQASSLETTYLVRKYYLAAAAVLCQDFKLSEICVGMNCHGPHWDALHDYLFQPGWKVFCGDYSNFDQNMSSEFLLTAWRMVIDCGNFPSEVKQILFSIATDISNPLTDFFGDLLKLSGTNPSGHPMTVIINGLVNSLYIRYAYFLIFGSMHDFERCVRMCTYGDDNGVSVHPDIQDRFNQVTVSAALQTICVKYTDAHKSLIVPEFTDPALCTFLKRSWVPYNDGVSTIYLAPLERDSIGKMLLIGIPNESNVSRHIDVLRASCLEMFHYGEVHYVEHLRRIGELRIWLMDSGVPTLIALANAMDLVSFGSWRERLMDRCSIGGMSWNQEEELEGLSFVV